MDWPLLGWAGLALLGLLLSAAAALTEVSAYRVNRVRLALRVSAGDPRATRLERELSRPDRLLATLMLFNNAMNYVMAMAIGRLTQDGDQSVWSQLAIDTLVITPLLLILGESLPKEVGRLEADRFAYRLARPLSWVRTLLTWVGVIPALMWLTDRAEAWVGLSPEGDHMSDARQRMAALLNEGASSGVLSESQSTLVDRALALRRVTIGDEMVPWSVVRTADPEWSRERAIRLLVGVPHSRLPVVDRRGRVVGVLRLIDLFVGERGTVGDLMREAVRLDPATPVLDAVRALRAADGRLGVVERGGRPIGVVTERDLVEPLTGELPDF